MSSESRNDGPEGSSDAAPGAADNDPFGGVVPYVPPIGVLRKLVQRSADGETVSMPLHAYRKLLECALLGVYDDTFYTTAYPDVKKAVEDKAVPSAVFHFVVHGYGEGRPPMRYEVDEAWYMARYPDVGAAVKDGRFPSAAFHFQTFGYAEGRAPNAAYEKPVAEWRDAPRPRPPERD